MTQIERAAVIGAGQMGHGIAQVLALGGVRVALYDSVEGATAFAAQRIASNLAVLVKAGLADAEAAGAAPELIGSASSLDEAVDGAALVVEAIAEELEPKQRLFAQLDARSDPHAILATNTSYFRVTEVGASTTRPERVVGSHFFMPADVIPLVEVVAGERSDPDRVRETAEIWRALGKLPILVWKDLPGFVANRLQLAITREALALVAAGVVSPADLDLAVRSGFGLRYPISGVLEQRELSGWSLHLEAARSLYPTLAADQTPVPMLEALVAAGEVGLRFGRGLYEWGDADPEAIRQRRHAQALQVLQLVGPWLFAPHEARDRDPSLVAPPGDASA